MKQTTEKRITNKIIYDELIKKKEHRGELIKKIDDIHKIIYGNSNTEKSFIHKFATVFTTLKIHWALFVIILGFFVKLVFFS